MNEFYNPVNDWLFVGADLEMAQDLTGLSYEDTVAQLKAAGVTHVIDCRMEWQDKAVWGLGPNYLHAPIMDSRNHKPDEDWYERIEAFVNRFWDESCAGDVLYVHCHMGINRGPSAAMLALLTIEPELSPFGAFSLIRSVRPQAGLVYAEAIGRRHLLRGDPALAEDDLSAYEALADWDCTMAEYWTPQRNQEVNRGISYYRDVIRGTMAVRTA